jgi:hypothetical protein
MSWMQALRERIEQGRDRSKLCHQHRVLIDAVPKMYKTFPDKQDHCDEGVPRSLGKGNDWKRSLAGIDRGCRRLSASAAPSHLMCDGQRERTKTEIPPARDSVR